jgi:hypothetical protein
LEESLVNPNKFDPLAHRADRIAPGSQQGHDAYHTRLAGVLRSLSGVPSRREVLRGLAAGLGLAAVPLLGEAKPKRRKKRKRPTPAKPNQYGCLEVNDSCRRHLQCCSGRCTGKPGRKRCRAHGTGTCNQTNLAVCEAIGLEQTRCNNSISCYCTRTTAGSSFCGDVSTTSDCAICKRDVHCVALGFPPGSACVPFATGFCAGSCPSGMLCMAPCGYVPPAM